MCLNKNWAAGLVKLKPILLSIKSKPKYYTNGQTVVFTCMAFVCDGIIIRWFWPFWEHIGKALKSADPKPAFLLIVMLIAINLGMICMWLGYHPYWSGQKLPDASKQKLDRDSK